MRVPPREETPAVLFGETRGSVVAEGECQQIGVVERVVQTSERSLTSWRALAHVDSGAFSYEFPMCASESGLMLRRKLPPE